MAETDESVVPMRARNAGDATMFSKLKAILYARASYVWLAERYIKAESSSMFAFSKCYHGLCDF